jgi:hypothetical protein
MPQALVQNEKKLAWLSVSMAFLSPLLLVICFLFRPEARNILWPLFLIYPAYFCAFLGVIWGIQARHAGIPAIAGILLNIALLILETWFLFMGSVIILMGLGEGGYL